jgi:hypothetical protein
VICKDLDREGRPLKVLVPYFKSMNDHKQFSIIDVIVSFHRNEGLGEIRAWMPVAIGVGLEKDCSGGIVRGIGGDGEQGSEIWKAEDWFGKKRIFEAVER